MAWMLSLKVFFISTGVLFTALGVKVSVPLFVEFVATFVPLMCNFFALCFKPPYIYVIINGIIITIVASSRFYHSDSDVAPNDHTELTPTPPSNVPPIEAYEMESSPEIPSGLAERPAVYNETIEEPKLLEVRAIVVNGASVVDEDRNEEEKAMEDMDSTWRRIKRMEFPEIQSENLSPAEKPLDSPTFGHRKLIEASPEGGRSLKVTKLNRHEKLEDTWRAKTEGRDMPLGKHMKKCATWENQGRQVNVGPLSVKKSQTFKDRTNELAGDAMIHSSLSPMKLQREASLSQDELNLRVEAFIRKFNEEMRLQRQASLNQYMELIKH